MLMGRVAMESRRKQHVWQPRVEELKVKVSAVVFALTDVQIMCRRLQTATIAKQRLADVSVELVL